MPIKETGKRKQVWQHKLTGGKATGSQVHIYTNMRYVTEACVPLTHHYDNMKWLDKYI